MTREDAEPMREAVDLLNELARRSGVRLPDGAAPAVLGRFRAFLGFPIPDGVNEWLSVHNGAPVPPAGIFGFETIPEIDLRRELAVYPSWRERRWIPIAGDGFGNYYVVDASQRYLSTDPVLFVETLESIDEPAYLVSSSVWRFLKFFLSEELGVESRWPFDEQYVLQSDTALAATPETLRPWT